MIVGRDRTLDVAGCGTNHGRRSGGGHQKSHRRFLAPRLPIRNALRYVITTSLHFRFNVNSIPPPQKKNWFINRDQVVLNNDGEAIVILLAANNWLSSNVSVSIHVRIDNVRDNVGNSHVDKTKAYCMPSKRDIKSIM